MSSVKSAKGELVFTGSLLAASIVVLVDAASQKDTGVNAQVGPEAFEYGIGALLFIFTALQLVSVLRGKLGEPEEIEGGQLAAKPNFKALAVVIVGIFYFVSVLNLLGYVVAAIPLFVAVTYALGEKRLVRSAIIATVVVLITFIGFTKGLNLQLPSGFEFLQSEPAGESW